MTGVSRNHRFSTETDLKQLLKCLKCQVKCPDMQKRALLSIHSICENEEDNMDLLREMGGVAFVYSLSKSGIIHPDVKQTALGTLGALAEANVHCKNDLCRKETFMDLADCLRKEDVNLTHKRVAVYLLFVLVANNKSGQILAQTTGCLAVLLDLFRTTFPRSAGAPSQAANVAQAYQVWKSVSCALCGCINNPQNEDGQRACVAVFPIVKNLLQHIDLPNTEIFQPLCSFIAMAVSNNSLVQESFSACGGLEILARALIRAVSAAHSSLQSCQLSAMISKTLSKCISNNCTLASCLAQYGVVSQLLFLLESPHLDSEEKHYVLHSLGSCTAASEEHQSQLLQCGGLPLIITLLTENTNEEIKKAAAFILQTCKQATKCLGNRQLLERRVENAESLTHLEGYRNSAEEFLHRIDQLTRNGASTERKRQHSEASGLPRLPQRDDHITAENASAMKKMNPCKSPSHERVTGDLLSSYVRPLEGGREPQTENRNCYQCSEPWNNKNSKMKNTAELQDSEMVEKIPVKEISIPHNRCAGCVLTFGRVTSRNFASILRSCHHRCDMHTVLQKATERFRMHHRKLLFRKEHRYDNVDDSVSDKTLSVVGLRRDTEKWNSISLIPLRRRAKEETSISHNRAGPSLTHIKRQHLPEDGSAMTDIERRKSGKVKLGTQQKTDSGNCYTKRKRTNFTCEEVDYLLTGVRMYGRSWNTILCSYPFQPGRTNVDLGMKYRRLMKRKHKVPAVCKAAETWWPLASSHL